MRDVNSRDVLDFFVGGTLEAQARAMKAIDQKAAVGASRVLKGAGIVLSGVDVVRAVRGGTKKDVVVQSAGMAGNIAGAELGAELGASALGRFGLVLGGLGAVLGGGFGAVLGEDGLEKLLDSMLSETPGERQKRLHDSAARKVNDAAYALGTTLKGEGFKNPEVELAVRLTLSHNDPKKVEDAIRHPAPQPNPFENRGGPTGSNSRPNYDPVGAASYAGVQKLASGNHGPSPSTNAGNVGARDGGRSSGPSAGSSPSSSHTTNNSHNATMNRDRQEPSRSSPTTHSNWGGPR